MVEEPSGSGNRVCQALWQEGRVFEGMRGAGEMGEDVREPRQGRVGCTEAWGFSEMWAQWDGKTRGSLDWARYATESRRGRCMSRYLRD